MEDHNVYSFTLVIDKEDRLDKHLKSFSRIFTMLQFKKWIASNNVKIDGKICNQKDKIKKSCNASIFLITPEVTFNCRGY